MKLFTEPLEDIRTFIQKELLKISVENQLFKKLLMKWMLYPIKNLMTKK